MSDEEPPRPLLGRGETVPRRRWRWMLPTFVAAAVLALAGVGFLALSDREPSPASVTDDYLNAVEAGRYLDAYQRLCSSYRRVRPYADYEQSIRFEKQEAGQVTQHRIGAVQRKSATLANVSYTVLRNDGQVFVDAAVKKEHGTWRVCGFNTRGVASTTTVGGP